MYLNWIKGILLNKYTLILIAVIVLTLLAYTKGRRDEQEKYLKSQVKEVIDYVDKKNKIDYYYDGNKFSDESVLSGQVSKNSQGCVSSDGMCRGKK